MAAETIKQPFYRTDDDGRAHRRQRTTTMDVDGPRRTHDGRRRTDERFNNDSNTTKNDYNHIRNDLTTV